MSELMFQAAVKKARENITIEIARPIDVGIAWAADRITELAAENLRLTGITVAQNNELITLRAENAKLRDKVNELRRESINQQTELTKLREAQPVCVGYVTESDKTFLLASDIHFKLPGVQKPCTDVFKHPIYLDPLPAHSPVEGE
jgi:cell division protein FtsB